MELNWRKQKIEKWRIEELTLVLKQLGEVLKKGNNGEWANVFLHFYQEAQFITASKELDLGQVKKLLRNIKNCFSGMSSLQNIVLWHENTEEKILINEEFPQVRARLLKILDEIESRTIEYVS